MTTMKENKGKDDEWSKKENRRKVTKKYERM